MSPARTPNRRSAVACLLAATLGLLVGCGGYSLGPSNGQAAGVRAIRIGHVANGTDEPR